MEEKDSAISGPYEEFRICFCGENIRSGYVEWYVIDVSVEEACLSEKTESSTRELTPFSVTEHLPSYAALGGLIYSLGGRERSDGGGDNLLNEVWFLDCKPRRPSVQNQISPLLSFRDEPGSGKAVSVAQTRKSKPLQIWRGYNMAQSRKSSEEVRDADDSIPPLSPSPSFRDELAPGEKNWQPERKTSELRVEDRESTKIVSGVGDDIAETKLVPGRKPGSGKAQLQIYGWVSQFNPTQANQNSGEFIVSRAQKSSTKVMCSHDILPDSDKASPTPLTAPNVEDWKRGLPMNFARYNPHTMVVDHKLYVLGGFLPNQNQAYGWIEVFDPEEKRWESLPSPPDQIHSSIMISGLLKSKKEIIIAKHRWDCRPLLFYSYNITTRCWNELSLHSDSKASVHSNVERAVILPPNIGRAVTVGNTLYWISTEEHNHECTIHAYDLDRNMWFEDHLNTATIFGRREYFTSIYSRGPGFLHLVDQKFCLLLQSSVKKKDPQSSIEYLYRVILDISPIYEHEHEDWGKFELTTVSVQKYSMDHYIHFLDCMLLDRVSGVKSVDCRGQSTSTNISFQEPERRTAVTLITEDPLQV